MRYRKLNNGDYTFGGNANDFYSGTLAVAQAIKTNLLLLYGEWWEDISKGLPLFQNILGQSGLPENVHAVDLLVREVISNTQGVLSISDFSSSYDKRTYTVTNCTVQTQYGEVTINDVVIF